MSRVMLDILLAVIVLTNAIQAYRFNKLENEFNILEHKIRKKEIDDTIDKIGLEYKILEALEKGLFVEIDGKVYQKQFTMDEEN